MSSQPQTPIVDLLPLPSGLVAVTGDEGTGKTNLLRRLGENAAALWLDLSLPGQDDQAPQQVWETLRQRCLALERGATVTCLDQPFAALDAPSARVIRDFLTDMADHATRTCGRGL